MLLPMQTFSFKKDKRHNSFIPEQISIVQTFCNIITKILLYNFDPLKPHFYKVKLGFTGVYIIFLILLKT